MGLDDLGGSLHQLDQHTDPALRGILRAPGMNEAHVVSGGAATDAARREPDALGLQPLHRRRQVVDPKAHVVERRAVDPRFALRIDGLHQVDLDRKRRHPELQDVLVHVLLFAAVGARCGATEQIYPQPAQVVFALGADGNLLDPKDAKWTLL